MKPPKTWRRWGRLLLNSRVGAGLTQIATVAAFICYFFVWRVSQGQLPLYPGWLAYFACAAAAVGAGVNVYLFYQGDFDEENPMLVGRRHSVVRRAGRIKTGAKAPVAGEKATE